MTIEEIKELLQIFIDSGVAELELQRGENRLRLRRAGTSQDVVVSAPAVAAPVAAPAAVAAPAETPAAKPPAAPKAPEADSSDVPVKAPILGTYYDAPSPDAPSFVRVGDTIEAGQVLCIIESMKLMNEVESEIAGVIVSKLVTNGRPVEYGDTLFFIRPR